MKNVYAINFYNETANTGPEIAGIYATEELAIEQLRRWRKAVEDGKWDGETLVKWYDRDTKDVIWMRTERKGYRYFAEGVTEELRYAVEPISVKETEDDLDR